MEEIIFLSVEIILMQLTGAYMLYLPFSGEITKEQIHELHDKLLIWSLCGTALNIYFLFPEIDLDTYRILCIGGWLPYIIISLTVIRGKNLQHIFVIGMQGLWSFLLQSLSAMAVTIFFGETNPETLLKMPLFYLLIFMALLPIERKFFKKILPTKKFFETRTLKWYVSFFPLAIFIGTYLPIAQVTILPSWTGKISRLIIPFFFFMMYRSMSITTQQIEEEEQRERTARILRRQLFALKEQNILMQKSRQEVKALRNNLNDNYRVMDELLNAGKIQEAMDFIQQQDELLEKTTVNKFCDAPLINAALSIYLRRAEEIGVNVIQKINLPENFSTDESELAVLMSNLLENAIQASEKQKKNQREISVIVQHCGKQFIMEISNRYDFPIKLGENDLPYSEKKGHGLGMTSLDSFAKRYDAYIDFSQENGMVKLSLYWEDKITNEVFSANS